MNPILPKPESRSARGRPGAAALGMLLAALTLALAPAAARAAPELVLVNADVFTGDAARPRARALAVEDGRIRAVGDDAEIRALADRTTRVIDVGGRLVTPGLTEAHVHLGWRLPSPPIALPGLPFPGPNGEQVLAAVADAVARAGAGAGAGATPPLPTGQAPGWISAWVGPAVARDPRNWRDALDAVAPSTPVLLRGFWGHTTIVNSAALRRLGIAEDVADPIGGWWGRDANGRLDGRAAEAAEELEQRIVPSDADRLAADLRDAAARYARWGVTSIHWMNSGRPLATAVTALARADTPLKWTVYSWAGAVPTIGAAWQPIERAPEPLPPRVRVDGPKWVLDGTGIEQNALRRTPYPGRGEWRGRSNYTDSQLRAILSNALAHPRHQLALHVVGDAETDRLLGAMETAAPAATWRALRVRIEHGDGLRADTLARAARLGWTVTQNPTHLPPPRPPGAPGAADPRALLASLADAGIAIALGSDGDADEANPFLNIRLATTYAASPGEALSRERALLAYTAGGAHAAKQEHETGRLMPGLAADLTVLSQDILAVPADALPATCSLLTLVDGRIVHEDPALTAGR